MYVFFLNAGGDISPTWQVLQVEARYNGVVRPIGFWMNVSGAHEKHYYYSTLVLLLPIWVGLTYTEYSTHTDMNQFRTHHHFEKRSWFFWK